MNEKLPLPTTAGVLRVEQQQQQQQQLLKQASIDNEDYRYESSYVEATAAIIGSEATAKANEFTSELYRYASLASLGGGGGGGVGGGGMSAMSGNMDIGFLGSSGSATATAIGSSGGSGGGVGVPAEFGGTLKSSKGSNVNSPHKQVSYCDCFGMGGNSGGSSSGRNTKQPRKTATISFWPALLANLGICTLLLGYLFIGSFVFVTIENSAEITGEVAAVAADGNAAGDAHNSAAWHFTHRSQMLTKQQQQQHQQHEHKLAAQQQQGEQLKLSQVKHEITASTKEASSSGEPLPQAIAMPMHMHRDNGSHNSASTATNTNTNINLNARVQHMAKLISADEEEAAMGAEEAAPIAAALTANGVIATPEAETYIDSVHVSVGTGNAAAIHNNDGNVDYELQTMSMDESAGEGGGVGHERAMADAELERTVENIWDITVSLNILYKENWTKLAALEISRFQDQLVKRLVLDWTLSTTANDAGAAARRRNTLQHLAVNAKHFSTSHPQNRQYPQQQQREEQQQKRFWLLQQHALTRREQQQYFEWNYATAFLYSLTVITTVGYGTITPRTTLGRMVTIAYATLGIPLMLIYLASIGSILAKLVTALCARAFCCSACKQRRSYCGFSRQQVSDKKCNLKLKQLQHHQQQQQQQQQQGPGQSQQQHLPYCYVRPPADINAEAGGGGGGGGGVMGTSYDTLNATTTTTTTSSSATSELRHSHALRCSLVAPVGFCLLLLLTYVGVGSIVIALLEQWSLFDGIYFCFMSLTTIGFCDLLPGMTVHTRSSSSSSSSSSFVVWFCAAYILSGLTLTSMCVNLLHEQILLRMRVVVKFKKIAAARESKERNFYGAPP